MVRNWTTYPNPFTQAGWRFSMDKIDDIPPLPLLPGQFSFNEALTRAIETANDAYGKEVWREKWPEHDLRVFKIPKEKRLSR